MTQQLREVLDVSAGGEIAVGAHGSIAVTTPGALKVDGVAVVAANWQMLLTVAAASPVGGGFVSALVFDATATTGGLYAWNGTDYTKVGLATS